MMLLVVCPVYKLSISRISFIVLLVFIVGYSFQSDARDLSFSELKFQGEVLNNGSNIIQLTGTYPTIIFPGGISADESDWIEIVYKRKNPVNIISVIYHTFDSQSSKSYENRHQYRFDAQQSDLKKIEINLKVLPNYQGQIKFLALLFDGTNEQIDIKKITLKNTRQVGYFTSLFNELLRYRHFKPSTINYMDGPTWGGMWINIQILQQILLLVFVSGFVVVLCKNRARIRSIVITVNLAFILLSWILVDTLNTVNQIRMYKQFSSAQEIMDNARTAGIFTQFLDFIRNNTKMGKVGYFIASPYFYVEEGIYHLYPHIRLGSLDDADYIFVFDRVTHKNRISDLPSYDAQSGELTFAGSKFSIRSVTTFMDNMVVYEVAR